VFFVDQIGRCICKSWAEQAGKYGLEILGIADANHVHVIAIPQRRILGKGTSDALRYSQYINRFHKRPGHLGRAVLLLCPRRSALLLAMKCIEIHPVWARLSGGRGGTSVQRRG
jgi:hypothetical protein